MPTDDPPHTVTFDAAESQLIKSYPVEKLIRTSVYITWPLILLNVIVVGVMLLAFLAQVLAGGSIRFGPGSPALVLSVVYLGMFAMLALNVAMSWFISTVNAPWLAAAAVAQAALAAGYLTFTLSATSSLNPTHYSPFYLLTVSPLYLLYFLVTMLVVVWFLYSFVTGIYALAKIPPPHRLFARPEYFRGGFNLRTLERYGGLPPVVQILPQRVRLKLLFYLSSLCFLIGLLALEQIAGSYFVQDAELRGICGSAGDLDACLRGNALNSQIVVIIIGLVLIVAAPRIGNALLSRMRKLSTYRLYDMQRIDPRPPVLFLRAFRDDQVALTEPKRTLLNRMIDFGRQPTNLDQLVLELATPYGPVVALGNPTDQMPPYGAARGYFDGKTWKQSVEQLGAESIAVVLCLDNTEGVWWEVNHLAQQGLLRKTLFLIHPKDAAVDANCTIVGQLVDSLSQLVPPGTRDQMAELKSAATGQPPVMALFLNDDGSTSVGRSSTFSRLAFTLAVRWFLRTKRGLEPALERRTADGKVEGRSANTVALIWFCVATVVAIAMGFIFDSLGLNAIPGTHRDDGEMLTGWLLGTALAVATGVALARSKGWRRGSGAFAIVWLGSAFIVTLLMWPMWSILGLASDAASFWIGVAFFLANIAAFAWWSRRRPRT